jgi:putative ABC transport system ATP-binding protein
MVTHDPVAALSADRIVFLRDGHIAGETPTHVDDVRARIERFLSA